MVKDFTQISAVNKTIAEATQEVQEKRKARKTYTEPEKADFLQEMKTAGRKGVHLPRINVAFSPQVYDYIRTMSKASGLSYTQFINIVLNEHKEAHEAIYQKAIEIRNSL